MSDNVANMVARTAFGRVNTSISIAIASEVSSSLARYVDRYNAVLICVVVYLCLAVVNGSFFKNNNTLSTAKSLIGIVGTTTIMHHITDVGTALIPGIPDGSTTSTSLILSRGGIPSAASVVLGTAFVMVSGSVASTSREAIAIRTGVQYAYSDILMAAIPDKSVRVAISMALLLMIPVSKLFHGGKIGPFYAMISALTLAGVSFIIDSAMPLATNNLLQDIIQGVSAVLLFNGILTPIPSLGDQIVPFASWIVARRLSNALSVYGILQMVAVVGVIAGVVESLRAVLKGSVLVTIRDLLVLVVAFLISSWIVASMNTGNPSDTTILLVSTMFIIHMAFAVMGDDNAKN